MSLVEPEQIFCCMVCQKAVVDVYAQKDAAGQAEVPGLHGSATIHDGKIPRMWFFPDCCHLVCGVHLPGGGMCLLFVFEPGLSMAYVTNNQPVSTQVPLSLRLAPIRRPSVRLALTGSPRKASRRRPGCFLSLIPEDPAWIRA